MNKGSGRAKEHVENYNIQNERTKLIIYIKVCFRQRNNSQDCNIKNLVHHQKVEKSNVVGLLH